MEDMVKTAYKVLAYVVAAEVVVQAMAIVFAIAGLGKWVEEGGVLTSAVMESEDSPFPEVVGFIIHGMNGMIVMPVLALALLVVSFFTRFPKAVQWAGLVLLLVVVQIGLGVFGHQLPALGALHGLNALLLFSMAVHSGRRVRGGTADPTGQSEARAATAA
jgi:uncharacterized membrane protein YphA (DoxX/SURF4 family)